MGKVGKATHCKQCATTWILGSIRVYTSIVEGQPIIAGHGWKPVIVEGTPIVFLENVDPAGGEDEEDV